MIQDIAPQIYRNEYRPVPPDGESYLLAYEGRGILAKENGSSIQLPQFKELEHDYRGAVLYDRYQYLFQIDDMRFYLLPAVQDDKFEIPEGYEYLNIQVLRSAHPAWIGFAGITGFQLNNWYASHKYCGKCGKELVHDEKERMMHCRNCGLMEYPKICPAVIVAVTDGDRILLTKYAGREYKKYALVAGFTEIGETIEVTVSREVLEEVGLHVKNIRYYKSQPWSFSDTLLMGFFCDVDGACDITLDTEELSVGEWCDRGEVPADGTDASLTHEMMHCFKKGCEPR